MRGPWSWLILFSIAACATALTPEGSQVRIVTMDESDKCSPITDMTALAAGTDDMSSLNELRNKTARVGGNAMLIDKTRGFVVGGYSRVIALRCPESAKPQGR